MFTYRKSLEAFYSIFLMITFAYSVPITYIYKNQSNAILEIDQLNKEDSIQKLPSLSTSNVLLQLLADVTVSFTCTNSYQSFTVPVGVTTLSVQAYGASGGASTYNSGGYGAYMYATITVTSGQTLYVYVGCQGTQGSAGYNGGGAPGATYGGGGGGATDIRSVVDSLIDRLVVAGGGGGGALDNTRTGAVGGNGGYASGGQGSANTNYTGYGGYGGSQTAGGAGGYFSSTYNYGGSGTFGNGGAGDSGSQGGGGGGGYYGGGGGSWTGGGGGSSYTSGTIVSTSGSNSGNGALYITYTSPPTAVPTKSPTSAPSKIPTKLPSVIPTMTPTIRPSTLPTYLPTVKPTVGPTMRPTTPNTVSFTCTNSYQTFNIPVGVTTLSVQAYGASGGASTYNSGGYGAYMYATITVTSGQTLYVYVGCQGTQGSAGYNGGGAPGASYGGGGGGATDIRSVVDSLIDRLVVAGGGGGGALDNTRTGAVGGNGGYTSGGQGSANTNYTGYGGYGGSQTAGGAGGYFSSTYNFGNSGTFGNGGAGASGSQGGGGGGGYYGGGGGAWTGGGGGSSYTSGTIVSTSGSNSGNGALYISFTSPPTAVPTKSPTSAPSKIPTKLPSVIPTMTPTIRPSTLPTYLPTVTPSTLPTTFPTYLPTIIPSIRPSTLPTTLPTVTPTIRPTTLPTSNPTSIPTFIPTVTPTMSPSMIPSAVPTSPPSTSIPTTPTVLPSEHPTSVPTGQPSSHPSTYPTNQPSAEPTGIPTIRPFSQPTSQPTGQPSARPTPEPTGHPTGQPSGQPSAYPTNQPSSLPTGSPTSEPSGQPTSQPSGQPSVQPSSQPTGHPTGQPSGHPSAYPTNQPSTQPTSLPSNQPSGQPTSQPSGQPSARPTPEPTGHPTGQPSGQPSAYPTNRPSSQPTGSPTTEPSGQPSSEPTGQPSVQPSSQPTGHPTGQPSGHPSAYPTNQPSTQPTSLPSNQPSAQPTSQPTGRPSSQPTGQPTSQPSTQPSSIPSNQPSSQPSSQPTSQPTGQPSSFPSSLPTSQPSPKPTIIPTNSPTVIPTTTPTNLPTTLPSTNPTRRPTVIPSRVPSAKPSMQPVSVSPTSAPVFAPTSTPTKVGATNPPTTAPTSQPTWNLHDYESKRIYYKEYKPLVNHTAIFETRKTFLSFVYKGFAKVGSCLDWNSFASNTLNVAVKSYYFASISVTYGFENFHTQNHNNITAVCSNTAIVTSIVTAIQSKTVNTYYPDFTSMCSGFEWRVFTCNQAPVLCLNCTGDCTCPGMATYVTTPCSTDCTSNTASYSQLIFDMKQRELYPKLRIIDISVSRASIEIAANISIAGKLFCWAAPENTTLTSAYTVKQYGSKVMVLDPANNITLLLDGLAPSTNYDVYCYTEDSSGNGMDLSTMKNMKYRISTDCCPTIVFTTTYSSIVEYSANYTVTDDSIFSFTLEKTPTTALIVLIVIEQVRCSNGIVDFSGGGAVTSPSTFLFANGSVILSGNFLVHGSPGCYELTATGNGLQNSSVTLFIYNSSTIVNPEIKSAYFSSDASSVYVTFDSATNYGKTKIATYNTGFTCSLLLLFKGSDYFTCKWLSNKLIFAYLVSKTTESPAVGDTVQLIPGVLAPACKGKICTAASTTTTSVSIRAPTSPVDPKAALSAPSLVSSCSNIIIDPTASIGNGIKDWSTVTWFVTSNDFDASPIADYLNTYHNSTTSSITIANSYLTSGTITFSLYLVNFLGRKSFATATVVISSSSDIPYTTISGSSTVSIYRWQALSLFASATVSSCGGSGSSNSSSNALSYSWKVYQGISYQSSLSSTSLNPRYFKLAAYNLNTLTQYTIQVTTASIATGSFSSATVSVYVQRSGVVAVISGGEKRVVSSLVSFSLDASSSYDEDYPGSQSNLTYSWKCSVITPVYGDPCGVVLDKTSKIVVLPGALAARTYNFTVVATAVDGVYSTSSTTITVLDQALPSVTFNNLQSKYNPEDRIIVGVIVKATDSLKTEWSCPGCGLNLSSVTSTLLTSYFAPGTVTIQLSLKANTFSSGLLYTLQLSCTYYNLTKPSSSYAQATLNINSPPIQGQLVIDPITGTALVTSFYLNTYGWIDDASDYPISYTMTYYTKYSSSTSTLKSLGELQYISAFIGQGLSVNNYIVTCVATAQDIYGCSNDVVSYITVLPPVSISALQSGMSTQLALAAETSNPELSMQTSSAASSSLNAASCSGAPDCTALNRSTCDTVNSTCGPCLPGYLGIVGYANSPCQRAVYLHRTGDTCLSNEECISNFCSNQICMSNQKLCPNNCTYQGDCQYFDSNTDPLATCDANDNYCKAKCSCYPSWYGADCSLTLSAYNIKLDMREEMCISFYNLLEIQDTTSDVVVGRATLLSSLLLDPTQLSDNALSNCTLALTTTVQLAPSLCAEDEVFSKVIAGLSRVLESGKSLSTALSTQVSSSIDVLQAQRQLSLAATEESSVVTDNLRMYSTVSYKSDLVNQLYSLPQTDFETFSQVIPAQVQIGSTASDASAMVRVSLSQSNINYRNDTTDASIVKLQVYYDSTIAKTSAKIYMQNGKKIKYTQHAAYNTTVVCEATVAATAYNKSVNCSTDPSLVVLCPGTIARTYTAQCPASQLLPQCLSWNGVKYYPDPSCRRVTYSPTNTSCECSGSNSTASRRQLDAATDVNRMAGEFSASAMIEVQAFVSTWSSAADLSASSITNNYIIVVTVSVLLGIFLLGFISIFIKREASETKNNMGKSSVAKLTLGTVNEFFDSILPQEFKFRPWYSNFWIKLLECHPHLAYFAPARGRRLYHTKKWLCFFFELLFFIFMDSIFSPLAAADDSTCIGYGTPAACIQPVSFDMVSTVCVWDNETETCVYNPPVNSFTITLIVVIVASVCSKPFDLLGEVLIENATARTVEEIELAEKRDAKTKEEIGTGGTIVHHLKRRSINSVMPIEDIAQDTTSKVLAVQQNQDSLDVVSAAKICVTKEVTSVITLSDTRKVEKLIDTSQQRVEPPSRPLPPSDPSAVSVDMVVEDMDDLGKIDYDYDSSVVDTRPAQIIPFTTTSRNRSSRRSLESDIQCVDYINGITICPPTNIDVSEMKLDSSISNNFLDYQNAAVGKSMGIDDLNDSITFPITNKLEGNVQPKKSVNLSYVSLRDGNYVDYDYQDQKTETGDEIPSLPDIRTPDKNQSIIVKNSQKVVKSHSSVEMETKGSHDDLMTVPSLMMLAARLVILQNRMEHTSPEEELQYLLQESEEFYETDVIADANINIGLLHQVLIAQQTPPPQDQGLPLNGVSGREDKEEVNVKVTHKILNKIKHVRSRAHKIIEQLEELESEEEKEKYLLKRFIVELKKGIYKKIIFQHFFELDEVEEENPVHWAIRLGSIVALFLLAVGCLFYILLTGISLGQSTTILWLQVLAIALVQDVFLLKPLGIWFKFIAIAGVVSSSVRNVTDLIHDRVHLILRRTKGVVCHNSLLVQHFNAACRAARAFPHLQTSRLLIALNDYDLPKSIPNRRRVFSVLLDMIFLLFVLVIVILTTLPELFQETIIESAMSSFVNFPIYGLLLLSNLSIALPIVAVVLVLLVFAAREYYLYYYRKRILEKRHRQEKLLVGLAET